MDDFDPREIQSLLSTSGSRTGPDCPDVQVLTAALDGEYVSIPRAEFDRHVASCDHCVALMGRIARLKRHAHGVEIPELTAVRASKLIGKRPVSRRAPAWAAAAMIGFAAIMTAMWFSPFSTTSEGDPPAAPEVRNIDPDAYRPQVVFPKEGSVVDLLAPQFEWSAVPGSLHYDVRIVSADGTMVWQERVQQSEWRLPAHLQLAVGEDYYFRVDAYLSQAKSLSSRHVMFRVSADD